ALGSCASQECHRKGGNRLDGVDLVDAPYGLWLHPPPRFAVSAIDRIAHQTELGDQSGGIRAEKSPRFGVRMALVAPRNPGGSYLMYKLLLSPKSFEACGSDVRSSL